jgi:hypothetical protein
MGNRIVTGVHFLFYGKILGDWPISPGKNGRLDDVTVFQLASAAGNLDTRRAGHIS